MRIARFLVRRPLSDRVLYSSFFESVAFWRFDELLLRVLENDGFVFSRSFSLWRTRLFDGAKTPVTASLCHPGFLGKGVPGRAEMYNTANRWFFFVFSLDVFFYFRSLSPTRRFFLC